MQSMESSFLLILLIHVQNLADPGMTKDLKNSRSDQRFQMMARQKNFEKIAHY